MIFTAIPVLILVVGGVGTASLEMHCFVPCTVVGGFILRLEITSDAAFLLFGNSWWMRDVISWWMRNVNSETPLIRCCVVLLKCVGFPVAFAMSTGVGNSSCGTRAWLSDRFLFLVEVGVAWADDDV